MLFIAFNNMTSLLSHVSVIHKIPWLSSEILRLLLLFGIPWYHSKCNYINSIYMITSHSKSIHPHPWCTFCIVPFNCHINKALKNCSFTNKRYSTNLLQCVKNVLPVNLQKSFKWFWTLLFKPLPNLPSMIISSTFSNLHWLPAEQRIAFKVGLLVYKTLLTGQTQNFKFALKHQKHLPSNKISDLLINVPKTNNELGKGTASFRRHVVGYDTLTSPLLCSWTVGEWILEWKVVTRWFTIAKKWSSLCFGALQSLLQQTHLDGRFVAIRVLMCIFKRLFRSEKMLQV